MSAVVCGNGDAFVILRALFNSVMATSDTVVSPLAESPENKIDKTVTR